MLPRCKPDAISSRPAARFCASGGLVGTASSIFTRSEAPYAEQDPGVQVLNPRNRVPRSFIIHDSTCLVNMGHYCTPQFGAAFPKREISQKDWKSWPREIPDRLVREFGEWCANHEVKGKYSIVPITSRIPIPP
ncbi:MAG: hypothetical protein ACKVHO_05355 [Verrucomicrobiia bacterium]|jgi:hypothetical protein